MNANNANNDLKVYLLDLISNEIKPFTRKTKVSSLNLLELMLRFNRKEFYFNSQDKLFLKIRKFNQKKQILQEVNNRYSTGRYSKQYTFSPWFYGLKEKVLLEGILYESRRS